MNTQLMADLLAQIKDLPECKEPPRYCQCDLEGFFTKKHKPHMCRNSQEIKVEREGKILHVCSDCKLPSDKEV